MNRRSKIALIVAGVAAGVALIAVVGALLVLPSPWFREKVRERIVAELERATGGRSEVGAFFFDWKHLRAEIHNFVLHGTEGPDRPPLFQARTVAVGLKIISLWKKQVDIESLEVDQPHVYLVIYPNGRTNLPAPKVAGHGKPAMERILDLAVRRFSISRGLFDIEGRKGSPFQARGENLAARFDYSFAEPAYRGRVSIDPLAFDWSRLMPMLLSVDLDLAFLRNRIEVAAGKIRTGHSEVDISGAVTDMADWTGFLRYRANASVEDVGRIVNEPRLKQGQARAEGEFRFQHDFKDFSITGVGHAENVVYRDRVISLRNVRGDARLDVGPDRVEVREIRAAGLTTVPFGGKHPPETRVYVRAERLVVRGRDVAITGIRADTLGGSFSGSAAVLGGGAYRIAGDLHGIDIREVVALASSQKVPWDGRIAGPVSFEGSSRRRNSLKANARLTISPAGSGPAVSGSLAVAYDEHSGTVDLGRSSLQLPATRAEFSGVLGRALNVRLESRNLEELMPAIAMASSNAPKALPVRLENGSALFDGSVTGPLAAPRVSGRLAVRSFAFGGARFDRFQANIDVAAGRLALDQATLEHGALRAGFSGEIALRNWKVEDASALTASGSVRNAALADLLTAAGHKEVPVTGILSGSAKLNGTVADPRIDLDATATRGSIDREPFDTASVSVRYVGNTAEGISGQLVAGAKRMDLKAEYRHSPGSLATGRVVFEVRSNTMPVDQFHMLATARPGLAGSVQLTAGGTVEVGGSGARVLGLNGDIAASNLQMEGRPLGNAHLVANTKGDTLSAVLTSNMANATLRADGQWQLKNDYPGSTRVTFANLDFVRVWDLISPPVRKDGRGLLSSIQGEATVSGPALKPELWQAKLAVSQFQFGPAPSLELGAARQDFTLRNNGPLELSFARNVVKVDRARFVGHSTDLTLTGSLTPRQKNVYDLRLNGRLDLAVLQDFSRDLTSSGVLMTDATVRGPLDQPQVNGKLEVQNGAVSLASIPNGIYNANGTVLFSGGRAIIQRLTGESGGGKIRIGGFVGYEEGQPIFRLYAVAEQVRVRYPQGVSTVADARLNWTGTEERSTLTGTVTIVRTGFNPHEDFSSILASSAQPVRTPSARTGILSGTHFDVQIETSPDVTFESTLAQDIQIEANMRLRGTGINPSILGRINITQGELIFFGTRYQINQGSITFFNPARIEPILNVDLETKARGIDVTLTVSGPVGKLNLTPRSDPPLQFSEIVALLATGRTPTSDPSLLSQQPASGAQSWQQMGASALLSQAIAAPVAGRLQRFFGVTKLKIDPTLAGVENNPQARLTLEQQITPNITFTYITNVTSSNPLIVQVEWTLSRKWSVLAIRDENGLFGLDFLYKRRF